jgi:hypothetical protein
MHAWYAIRMMVCGDTGVGDILLHVMINQLVSYGQMDLEQITPCVLLLGIL